MAHLSYPSSELISSVLIASARNTHLYANNQLPPPSPPPPAPWASLQVFQEIIVNRSLSNLRKILSPLAQADTAALAIVLRTPDADRDHATPFLLACLSGDQGICSYLLELGADIQAKSSRCVVVT